MFGWPYTQNSTSPVSGAVYNNAATFGSDVSSSGVTHYTYYSVSMQRTIGYNVYLPPEYASQPNATFNTIFFMPGSTADNSESHYVDPVISHYAGAHPVIVVFPSLGLGSQGRDALPGSPMYGVQMTTTTNILELLPIIDGHFRTKNNRGGRAISGFSFGGFNAMRWAMLYPELFSSVVPLGTVSDIDHTSVNSHTANYMANFFNSDNAAFDASRIQAIVVSNLTNILTYAPAIHMVVGDQASQFYASDVALDGLLTTQGITHDAIQILAGVGDNYTDIIAAMTTRQDLEFMWNHFS